MVYKLKTSTLSGLVSLSCLYLSIACEEVTIFAEPERSKVNAESQVIPVGMCMTDEDCPQWSCVSSSCVGGACIPERQTPPLLTLEPILLEEPLVSIAMEKDRLLALVGEISSTTNEEENSFISVPHSLGSGEKILQWSLSAPFPQVDAGLDELRAYATATWMPENQWQPELQKITRSFSIEENSLTETTETLTPKALTLHNQKVWIHAGDQLRDLWLGRFGQNANQGQFFQLASPIQSVVVDGEEAWVSIFDKGLERLSLTDELPETEEDEDLSQVANARFNTPGRALYAKAGRSFVVVADGYAGLSLFNKRASSSLENQNPARRLVTPPQELSTEGRTVHLDLIEDKIISAELGLGITVSRVNTVGGLQKIFTQDLGGIARWVQWIDPYTALVWVDHRGVIVLDLLSDNEQGVTLVEETIRDREQAEELKALVWTGSGQRFAFLTPEGRLYHGNISCLGDE